MIEPENAPALASHFSHTKVIHTLTHACHVPMTSLSYWNGEQDIARNTGKCRSPTTVTKWSANLSVHFIDKFDDKK